VKIHVQHEVVVPVGREVLDDTEPLIRDAARLAEIHRLRAYDAVHLTSAQLAAARSEEELTLPSWDVELERAAVDEGVRLIRRRPG
jgi:predicted nucleic acid-binding protein